MKKIKITLLLLFIFTIKLNAQYIQNLADLQGKPLTESKYSDITGTVFLFEDWLKGSVEQGAKISYKDVDLKYNTYTDELFFKNPKDGAMLSFVSPATAFSLTLNGKIDIYRNGFPEIDNFNTKSYYQVIFDGGIKLLFKSYKTLSQIKPYNSTITEKKFVDNFAYYVFKDNVMTKFKPSKNAFLEILSSKSSEIDAFIKKEKINFKDNQDLAKVFVYYSTLL
jgi:hypothetical protein